MTLTMPPELREQLDALYAEGLANDATHTRYTERMMHLEPQTAELVALLLRLGQRRSILEIGTSSGYSTLWLAWAASTTGGHVTSIDLVEHKHALAEANLRRAGLHDQVTLLVGDATAIVTELSGPFDAVFFDADRVSAPRQLELLLPKLTSNALLMHDNATLPPGELAPYLAAVAALPRVDHMVFPIGKGLSVAYRAGA